jgi:hypothetical protein
MPVAPADRERKKPRALQLGAKSTNWKGGGDNCGRKRMRDEIKYIDCLLRCNKRVVLFSHKFPTQIDATVRFCPASRLESEESWNAQ